jgi:hypothetical protein
MKSTHERITSLEETCQALMTAFDRLQTALMHHMEREEKIMQEQATHVAYQIRELAILDHGDLHACIEKIAGRLSLNTRRIRWILWCLVAGGVGAGTALFLSVYSVWLTHHLHRYFESLTGGI